jgi:NAD-dependent histone deacetylase SIR2
LDVIDAENEDAKAIDDHNEPSLQLDGALLRRELKSIGPTAWIQKYYINGDYTVRQLFSALEIRLPTMFLDADDEALSTVLYLFLKREYDRREKLTHVNTIGDVVNLLKSSSNILVITGAGISTSLGIPDFRSSDGIYSRLEKYNLTDPQEMFDIGLFRTDPSIFFDFCKELLPEERGYSPTHAFIRLLQDKQKLLTQYTQNIDDIESSAGVDDSHLIQCHGSFKRATCMTCGRNVPGSDLFPDILAGKIPRCQVCLANLIPRAYPKKNMSGWQDDDDDASDDSDASDPSFAVMKPDITFFGEQLPTAFKDRFSIDRHKADLMICIGTSLRVAPVAEMPNLLDQTVPQVLISRDKLHKDVCFDVEFLNGDCDAVCTELAYRAGWDEELEMLMKGGRVPGRGQAQRAGDRLQFDGDHTYSFV